ncbi:MULTISPECIES: hypothetical protein [Citrobacter]|uniref:hypothetical protein n=1 Tax=Citrobacter TaxID=544 RepID=UPI0018FF61A7|nr:MULTISPECIES: hypothetical protein [Citrobacter]MBJ9134407.1 hypothetical protein [Citrobacter farmeri]MDM2738408.1 hypothetical protein [Citrobacter sp. Ct235]
MEEYVLYRYEDISVNAILYIDGLHKFGMKYYLNDNKWLVIKSQERGHAQLEFEHTPMHIDGIEEAIFQRMLVCDDFTEEELEYIVKLESMIQEVL